jgi:hypothetical protein
MMEPPAYWPAYLGHQRAAAPGPVSVPPVVAVVGPSGYTLDLSNLATRVKSAGTSSNDNGMTR